MEQDFRKTKIRIKSEEHSKAFQEAVFTAGGGWLHGVERVARLLCKEFLFVSEDLRLSYCNNAVFFQEHDYKEIQFPFPTKGHVHAELMAQYAEDAKTHAVPWKLWQTKGDAHIWWDCRAHPMWGKHTEYRRKPKMKMIHGTEVPDLSFTPKVGEGYYFICLSSDQLVKKDYHSKGCMTTKLRAVRGLCYPDTTEGRQAAIIHGEALLNID